MTVAEIYNVIKQTVEEAIEEHKQQVKSDCETLMKIMGECKKVGDIYIVINPDNTARLEVMKRFDISHVHEVLGGFMEIVRLGGGIVMLVDDCGLINQKQQNEIATGLYGYPIMGTAILCKEAIIDGEPDLNGLDPDELTHCLRIMTGN